MRNNSGDDGKRNNLHDPTLREKQEQGAKGSVKTSGGQSTTGMGSGDRKDGQRGDRA